ncbi:hypothetical protein AWZ03_015044 [Drosophila navojoa]|uniref:Uncharacterized protein n=1 Tax=Drosophila navojoa TaxID=7232 RepID=A0A484APV6_DRONA|nr:hypothetical protein AWZ03_015044 [Drosophila navojoa]
MWLAQLSGLWSQAYTLFHFGHSSTAQATIPPHQQSSTSGVQINPQPSAPATTLLSKDGHSDDYCSGSGKESVWRTCPL